MMLAFMAHGYIWGGDTPSEVCFTDALSKCALC
jgi:hypothetical protein